MTEPERAGATQPGVEEAVDPVHPGEVGVAGGVHDELVDDLRGEGERVEQGGLGAGGHDGTLTVR